MWTVISAILRQTEIQQLNLASSQPGPHLTRQIKFSTSIKHYSNKPAGQEKAFWPSTSQKDKAFPMLSTMNRTSRLRGTRSAPYLNITFRYNVNGKWAQKKFSNFKIWECSSTWLLVPQDLPKYISWSNSLSFPYLISNSMQLGWADDFCSLLILCSLHQTVMPHLSGPGRCEQLSAGG